MQNVKYSGEWGNSVFLQWILWGYVKKLYKIA